MFQNTVCHNRHYLAGSAGASQQADRSGATLQVGCGQPSEHPNLQCFLSDHAPVTYLDPAHRPATFLCQFIKPNEHELIPVQAILQPLLVALPPLNPSGIQLLLLKKIFFY